MHTHLQTRKQERTHAHTHTRERALKPILTAFDRQTYI